MRTFVLCLATAFAAKVGGKSGKGKGGPMMPPEAGGPDDMSRIVPPGGPGGMPGGPGGMLGGPGGKGGMPPPGPGAMYPGAMQNISGTYITTGIVSSQPWNMGAWDPSFDNNATYNGTLTLTSRGGNDYIARWYLNTFNETQRSGFDTYRQGVVTLGPCPAGMQACLFGGYVTTDLSNSITQCGFSSGTLCGVNAPWGGVMLTWDPATSTFSGSWNDYTGSGSGYERNIFWNSTVYDSSVTANAFNSVNITNLKMMLMPYPPMPPMGGPNDMGPVVPGPNMGPNPNMDPNMMGGPNNMMGSSNMGGSNNNMMMSSRPRRYSNGN